MNSGQAHAGRRLAGQQARGPAPQVRRTHGPHTLAPRTVPGDWRGVGGGAAQLGRWDPWLSPPHNVPSPQPLAVPAVPAVPSPSPQHRKLAPFWRQCPARPHFHKYKRAGRGRGLPGCPAPSTQPLGGQPPLCTCSQNSAGCGLTGSRGNALLVGESPRVSRRDLDQGSPLALLTPSGAARKSEGLPGSLGGSLPPVPQGRRGERGGPRSHTSVLL